MKNQQLQPRVTKQTANQLTLPRELLLPLALLKAEVPRQKPKHLKARSDNSCLMSSNGQFLLMKCVGRAVSGAHTGAFCKSVFGDKFEPGLVSLLNSMQLYCTVIESIL